MKRLSPRQLSTLVVIASIPLAGAACGRAVVAPTPVESPVAPSTVAPARAPASAPATGTTRVVPGPAEIERAAAPNPALARLPGDFVVFRYSGSFRKTPLTLTERVVAREGMVLIVDFTLADGKKEDTLRVSLDYSPGSRNEVLEVVRIERGLEKQSSREEWEAMMAKTVVVVDANEEDLGSEDTTVKVAGSPSSGPIAARTTSYRVTVGSKSATLAITRSASDAAFGWGDLGGEIRTAGGGVIYRAELVQMGSGAPASDVMVAKKD
jgi:hypothetical protein